MDKQWKIYWSNYVTDSYLYGSEITFLAKDNVVFRNALLPPGTVINRWYSKANFQAMRVEPSLPMIDGENRYSITADISEERKGNNNGYLIRIIFYDRYEQEADSIVLRGDQAEFQCPLKTYSYEVQLISAGITAFHFHSMTITELSHGKQSVKKRTE